jgi:ComF family protein
MAKTQPALQDASMSDRETRPQSSVRRLSVVASLLNLLFPPRCVGCNTWGAWLCPSCMDEILFFEPPWPPLLDAIEPLQGVRAAAHLSGPLREAIHRFKYRGLRVLSPVLGEMLYDCWDAEPWPVDVIVPVPLHPQRQRERGYNQSALLARELARHTGLPAVEGVLLRIVPTPPQVGLRAIERADNVRGAFRCRHDALAGKHVLLVDDVLTTGATLRACANALLEGKAQAVWGLTLAHD